MDLASAVRPTSRPSHGGRGRPTCRPRRTRHDGRLRQLSLAQGWGEGVREGSGKSGEGEGRGGVKIKDRVHKGREAVRLLARDLGGERRARW